jgi:predicted lipoprotein with Yx(FWY)xxD motif
VRRASIVVVVAVAIAVLAGCGSSSSTSTSTSASSASTPAATSTSAATSSTPATKPVALLTTKHTKLGTVLGAGPKKLTVYLFAADTASKSACSGACAKVWPPVTTSGHAQAGGHAMAADLGTITRDDGTMQVTYQGHPLYFYIKDVKDGDAGDTYGQGLKSFGADWYVLAPSGNKIDKS